MTDTLDATGEDAPVDLDVLIGKYERDPQSEWKRRREAGPVHTGHVMMRNVAQIAGNAAQFSGMGSVYSAYTFEAVQHILRTPEDFTSKGFDDTIGLVMGHTILAMDAPEHMAHRSLVAQAFRMKEMGRWEERFIDPLINRLIDEFADRGHADLVAELTFQFPIQVIAAILGLPEGEWPEFQRLAGELIDITGDPEKGINASIALRGYFTEIVADRRKEPKDDLITVLTQAEVDGEQLTDELIYSFLLLLLPAGAETTFRSSSSLIFQLLTHPDQYELLVNDRSLLPQAIEEALRFEPPLTMIMRNATRDLDLFGTPISSGAAVVASLSSANRDPAVCERPDEFDITRTKQEHIAFASGPHICLGMHLARAETRAVLTAIMDRLPNLKLDQSSDPHIMGTIFRSPATLPVTWDVQR
jgi:cytochrome P450